MKFPRSRAGCWDLRRIIPLERCHQSALAVTFNLITNKSAGLQLNFTDHVAIPKIKIAPLFRRKSRFFAVFFFKKMFDHVDWLLSFIRWKSKKIFFKSDPGKKKTWVGHLTLSRNRSHRFWRRRADLMKFSIFRTWKWDHLCALGC